MNQAEWNSKPVYMGFDLSEWSVMEMLRLLREGRTVTLYNALRWPWRHTDA